MSLDYREKTFTLVKLFRTIMCVSEKLSPLGPRSFPDGTTPLCINYYNTARCDSLYS